jgi:putrescine transport system substrate-binding protein
MSKVKAGFAGRRRWLVAAALAAIVSPGVAQTPSPFVPPPAPKPKILRLLAAPEFIDRAVLADFEARNGWAVAYDAYDSPDTITQAWKDGPYDLVILPGPALARRIGALALAKLDKSKLPNARFVQGAVAAKLAVYDPGVAYAVAFGWSPFGLIYDAGKASQQLGGAPLSWRQILLPREAARMSDCGVALPDSRDAVFIAVWRMMGVDPARAGVNEVKSAAGVLERAKPALQSLALRDMVGSLARGGVCLGAGTQGEAEAAQARGPAGGEIRFAYPREGGSVSIQAYAIPRDAPNPAEAHALLDFLARPDNAERDAKYAGLVDADDPSRIEALKRLSPEGAHSEAITQAIAAEWTKLRAAK